MGSSVPSRSKKTARKVRFSIYHAFLQIAAGGDSFCLRGSIGEAPRRRRNAHRKRSSRMKLLLHACCGPCSLEPTRLLKAAGHDITIYYANSNIHPAEEYEHRLATLRAWAADAGFEVREGPYDPATWEANAGRIRHARRLTRKESARSSPGALTTPPATGVRRLPIQKRKPLRMPQRQRQ